MLANTLCHIPRISLNKERALWDQGIHTWDDYRAVDKRGKHADYLTDAVLHLERGEPSFFAAALKSDQHWRLFPDFRDHVAYVDIETTGLDRGYDEITTIALYDGDEVLTYVNGRNLEAFKKDIAEYKVLVTFNGKSFDVPFIEAHFGVKLPHAHIDLRWVYKKLGYAGGLKEIERRMGIERGDELRSVDGFFAVILWNEFKRKKNEAALETLLAYNCADAVNLEALMVAAYNLNVQETPFGNERTLPAPKATAKIPHKADPKVVKRFCC